jgi:hypothetical protein
MVLEPREAAVKVACCPHHYPLPAESLIAAPRACHSHCLRGMAQALPYPGHADSHARDSGVLCHHPPLNLRCTSSCNRKGEWFLVNTYLPVGNPSERESADLIPSKLSLFPQSISFAPLAAGHSMGRSDHLTWPLQCPCGQSPSTAGDRQQPSWGRLRSAPSPRSRSRARCPTRMVRRSPWTPAAPAGATSRS